MNNPSRRITGLVPNCLACLNISVSLVATLFAYSLAFERQGSSSLTTAYYVRRASDRINDLLGIRDVGFRPPLETGFALTAILLATVLFVFSAQLQLSQRFSRARSVMTAIFAYFSLPIFIGLALTLRREIWVDEGVSGFLRFSTAWAVLGAEVLSFIAFALWSRKRPLSLAFQIVLSLGHWLYWSAVLFVSWYPALIRYQPYKGTLALFVPTIVLFALACLLVVIRKQIELLADISWLRPSLSSVLLGCFSALLIFLLWGNLAVTDLSARLDNSEINVTMERTGCYGSCPVYRVVIWGEGDVMYNGYSYVRTLGPERGKNSREQHEEILRLLERAQFFSVDERAFDSCFDTPRVVVTVTIRGMTQRRKSVDADAGCAPKNGPQADILKAAAMIDTVVGSKQWTDCHHVDCVEGHSPTAIQ